MFSGKSEELVRRLRRYTIAGLNVQVFNHSIDQRYAKDHIASHSQELWKAHGVATCEEILKHVQVDTDVVVIDEAQFFPEEIADCINNLLEKDIIVIVAGLDTDFRGEPFGVMPMLLALADGDVIKLKAVCAVCKQWNATRTQRILENGDPAPYTDPLIKVGAKDSYQARCREHHEVPKA
jgi:thymidine kinase